MQELKLAVCGSQIVGLVPLGAMLSAADYFIEKENLFILSEDQKIRLVSLEALIEDVCRMHIFSFDKIPLSRVITCV